MHAGAGAHTDRQKNEREKQVGNDKKTTESKCPTTIQARQLAAQIYLTGHLSSSVENIAYVLSV